MTEYPLFKAPKWAKNPHLQTILPRFYFTKSFPGGEWQDFVTTDGDRVELTWFKDKTSLPRGIVCLFHGLEGSVDSHYITTLLNEIASEFWVVVVHFRGCGRRTNLLPRSYHSGDTADAASVIATLARDYPNLPIHGVGFSLGGNMLLKLLGEQGATSKLASAAVVSPPFDLAKCSTSISSGFSKLYERHLLRSMRKRFLDKAKVHNYRDLINLPEEEIKALNSFWAFDDAITGPLHGFNDANDYYTRSSAIGYMRNIRTRTLVLHAYDDPFMSPDIVPSRHDVTESVTLEVSENGGHVGFLQGTPWRPTLWLPGRIKHFLQN